MTCRNRFASDDADPSEIINVELNHQLQQLRLLISDLLKENQELRYALLESQSATPEKN